MRRTIGLAAAVALLASVALAGTSSAATASYTTYGSFTCDGAYSSGYTIDLWSKNPALGSAKQVGRALGFCEALDGTPYSGTFWTVSASRATWAVISWRGPSGQCSDGPRSYQLPTPVVQNAAPCAAFPGYRVSVQVQASVRS
jgi:hypothetical protein